MLVHLDGDVVDVLILVPQGLDELIEHLVSLAVPLSTHGRRVPVGVASDLLEQVHRDFNDYRASNGCERHSISGQGCFRK